MSTSAGVLYLLPVGLADVDGALPLPEATLDVARGVNLVVAENPRTARRFLARMIAPRSVQSVQVEPLPLEPAEVTRLMSRIESGESVAVMSEAGCPGVADPGQVLVAAAYRQGLRVVPLVGPSALLLALMASGLNGQRFTFHGYLPSEPTKRVKAIRSLESRSQRDDATQCFIETPYRSDTMLKDLVHTLHGDTQLCVACALTTPQERIETRSAEDWRKRLPTLGKTPCVFLLYRGPRLT